MKLNGRGRRRRRGDGGAALAFLVLAALVAGSAELAAAAIAPGDITTCSHTNSTQLPRISSVKTCASVSILSTSATGFSYAFSGAHTTALVSAAGACGDAVADGVGALCEGLDPGLAITGAAQVCANALAAVYSRTASGALAATSVSDLFDPRTLLGSGSGSSNGASTLSARSAFVQACAGGCNNAQSAAEALAQGAACGAARAVSGCVAVASELRGDAFARAFASVAADGWTKACADGPGGALAGANAMVSAAAASFASAIARVADKACASCPTCKCSKLPSLGLGINTAGRWGDTFAVFAGGKAGVARALSGAASALCASNGTVNASRASTDAAMAAAAGMVAGAVGKLRASSVQFGAGSACGGGSLATQLEAMKQASARAISDAGATVFGGWCPRAAAKLARVELLTKDTIAAAANKTAEACAPALKGGRWGKLLPGPKKAAAERAIAELIFKDAPVRQKFADALQEAQKCGCPPSLCLFCRRAADALPAAAPAAGAAERSDA